MTDQRSASGLPPVSGSPPPPPTALAHLRVLVPGAQADAIVESMRSFIEVVPLKEGEFELRFQHADPLGAIPVLDVYLRRLKRNNWREHVSIEMVPLAPSPEQKPNR